MWLISLLNMVNNNKRQLYILFVWNFVVFGGDEPNVFNRRQILLL